VLGGVGNFFLDPGDVEEDAAVRAAAAGFDFTHDTAERLIARQQFRRTARVFVALRVFPAFLWVAPSGSYIVFGDVIKHEALAVLVAEDAPFAAHRFQ